MKYKIVLKRKVVERGVCIVEAANKAEADDIADKIDLADSRLKWDDEDAETEVFRVEPQP